MGRNCWEDHQDSVAQPTDHLERIRLDMNRQDRSRGPLRRLWKKVWKLRTHRDTAVLSRRYRNPNNHKWKSWLRPRLDTIRLEDYDYDQIVTRPFHFQFDTPCSHNFEFDSNRIHSFAPTVNMAKKKSGKATPASAGRATTRAQSQVEIGRAHV